MNRDTPPFRIFYGWWVVLAAVVGVVFGYSSFTVTVFGLFVTSLEREFGWTRTEISLAATFLMGQQVVLAPIVGLLVDRFGPRKLLVPSLFAFGVSICILSSVSSSLWHFYLLSVLVGLAGLGTQPAVFTRLIVNWFDRRRGLALGITLSGVGLASVLLPSVLQLVMVNFGWRSAYLVQGVLVLCIALPVVFLVVRDRPAVLGLASDDSFAPTMQAGGANEDPGPSLRQALSERPFWQMLIAFVSLGFVSGGIIAHLAPLLGDRGFSVVDVSILLGLQGAAVVVGRISCGVLMDRLFAPYVAGAFILGPVIGLALLADAGSLPVIAFAVVVAGIGYGAEFDLMAYLISRYIGLRAYGRAFGLMYAAFGVGIALGPLAMGWSFDHRQSYSPMLWIFAAASLLAAVLLTLLGPYRRGVTEAAVHSASSVAVAVSSPRK